MTNIRDIQSEADMVALRESDKSVILMTPAWSIYPKKSLFDWLTEHDLGSLGLVTTGSGGLVVCRRGKPIHFEVVTSHMTADKFKAVILKASDG